MEEENNILLKIIFLNNDPSNNKNIYSNDIQSVFMKH